MATQIKLSQGLGSEKILSSEEAEAIVKEWAANMNRYISEAEVKCLADYLKNNNCKAGVEDFDKVLFGWYRRGENDTKNVADVIQGLLSGFENTQTKIVSLVEKAMEKVPSWSAPTSIAATKPSPSRRRNWPLSLRPSEDEYRVLKHYLQSKTSEESMKISLIFEELIAIHKLNRKGKTQESPYKEVISRNKGTLDDFLSLCKLTIEDLIPCTPHMDTTKEIMNFVEDLNFTYTMWFVCPSNYALLIARLSVYLSHFNEG